MSNLDTKEKILDAAEHLFARDGFHATSLRAITSHAGVNLAAVNYHFGSKDALLEAVFERRLIPLNEKRLSGMRAVRQAAGESGVRPAVHELVRAFVEPTLLFKDKEAGAKDFVLLISRSFCDPDDTVRKAFLRLLGPVMEYLYDSLKQALPEIDESVLNWRFRFALGTIANTVQVCDAGNMHELLCLPTLNDSKRIVDELVNFISAGLMAS